jgi:hypothetical protein
VAVSSRNIVVNLIKFNYKDALVQTYSQSVVRELKALGHEVTEIGPGTDWQHDFDFRGFDLVVDLDCGRNPNTGDLSFRFTNTPSPIPSVVWFIDSHGHPSLHHRLARNYDHVFFAVWSKRDLFASHRSAHWCPNATDSNWFNSSFQSPHPSYDFGFFGSKMGLVRATPMKEICTNHAWSCDVRQISTVNKHRWPHTANAMGNCKVLFNHGQKHDGPNLRVVESMAMGLPLISDQDASSGMDKLFTPWEHYYPYEYGSYVDLEHVMKLAMNDYVKSLNMGELAMQEVHAKHLIKHRVQQMMEVAFAAK